MSRQSLPERGNSEVYQNKDGSKNLGKKRKVTIGVGLDFGTSCTKVVFRDHVREFAWAIPFKAFSCVAGNNYLLLTKLYAKNDEYCLQGNEKELVSQNLKMNLMDSSEQNDDQHWNDLNAATAYIALVLNAARDWFLNETRGIYKGKELSWSLNIGIPSSGIEIENPMQSAFTNAAKSAWFLFLNGREINKPSVQAALSSPHDLIQGDQIAVIPEVVAQLMGYAESSVRDDGLHILIDVGAATMDVVAFKLFLQDGDNTFSILDTEVARLGAYEFYCSALSQKGGHSREKLLREENLADISHTRTFIQTLGGLSDREFKMECKRLMAKVIETARKHKDPRSKRWNTSLPVFLCGGGGNLKVYREARDIYDEWLVNVARIPGIWPVRLPMPHQDRFKAPGLDETGFHRLSVAYGLSFPWPDIGEIIPPSENEDIELPKSKPLMSRGIGKELV